MLSQKQKILVALKKAKTSIETLIPLIEAKNPDCFPIIQQNLAIIGLLKSANLLMLESHMDRAAEKLSGTEAKRLKAIQREVLKIVHTAQNK